MHTEHKPAERIHPGDYLPFRSGSEQWWLEVLEATAKRTRVWITVALPDGGQRVIKPKRDQQLEYRDVAWIIDEIVD